MSEEEIEDALQQLAWILSGQERRDVEDTAVHVWRIRSRAWSEKIIREYLPRFSPETFAEWEAAEASR